jgi:hypothetical protein
VLRLREREVFIVSFFFSFVTIDWKLYLLRDEQVKNVVHALLYLTALRILSLSWKKDDLCISDHCNKEREKRALLAFIFILLRSFRFPANIFTYSSLTRIVLGYYLTIPFVFRLHYSNNIFLYHNSSPIL